ncbi:MAG: SpoIIE family protein phosphatase [Leptospira sp.]|nr:SpoIIE family protein phosphatase [Leptospira sp.]
MNFFAPPPSTKVFSSVRFKIAIAYSILAIVNISIFSNLIFENQVDLIINNFKLHYDNFASVVSKSLTDGEVNFESEEGKKTFKETLFVNGITKFLVFDDSKTIVFKEDESEELKQIESYIQFLFPKSDSIDTGRYRIELDVKTYQVKIGFFMKNLESKKFYIYTEETVRIVQDRLRQLYIQIGVVIVLGILFHAFFAIYLYRLIFSRLTILKEVSIAMKAGKLDKRAEWNFKSRDELDDLGLSFNSMASTLQTKITEISELNHEIQIELEIGKEVQGFFLPNHEIFKKNDIAVQFVPMREVSGDVYNFYKFKDGSRGLFFADAMGHGVPAALVTTVINLGLHIILKKTNKPNEVMTHLNSYVSYHLKGSYFASGIFILFPANENIIYYSNAAQNDPLIFKRDNPEPTNLESMGLNLGMISPFEYPLAQTKFEPGDKLVVYSDGVTEGRNAEKVQFGNPKLNEIVTSNFDRSNQEISEIILKELTEFTDGKFDDDVTILVLGK